jgi:hypothetical protein
MTTSVYDQFPFGMKVSLDNTRIGEVVSYRPNNMIGVRILNGGSGETQIAPEYLVPLSGGRPSALRNFRAIMHCPAHFWQGMSGQPFTSPGNWLKELAEVAYQAGIQAQP